MIDPYIYPEGEWMKKRSGSFTSSQIGKLFTEPRSKEDKASGKLSETAKTYIMDKVSELLTGTIRNTYTTPEMQWGLDNESKAIDLLKDKYPDIEYYGAENPKFFQYSDFSGGSPDAILRHDILGTYVYEIKCPNPSQHIENLMADELIKLNKDYWYQLQMNMACVAKEYNINVMDIVGLFVSYCPLMIESKLRLKLITVYPDAEFQAKLPEVISKAENHLRSIIEKFEL